MKQISNYHILNHLNLNEINWTKGIHFVFCSFNHKTINLYANNIYISCQLLTAPLLTKTLAYAVSKIFREMALHWNIYILYSAFCLKKNVVQNWFWVFVPVFSCVKIHFVANISLFQLWFRDQHKLISYPRRRYYFVLWLIIESF